MMELTAARIRIDGANRVWVEGVGNADPLELVPNHRNWRKSRSLLYWRIAGSRRWHLTPGQAVKAWLAEAENRA